MRVSWTLITRSTGSLNIAWKLHKPEWKFLDHQFCRYQPWACVHCLSVFLLVTSSVVRHEDGGRKVRFFLSDWDWLRGCANLCFEEIRPVEVSLLQTGRKNSFSPYVGRPEKASKDQVAISYLYPSPKIYIKCWHRKKLALGRSLVSLNAATNTTHSAIVSQDSSGVTTTFNAHCTLYSGRFLHRVCKSRCKVGTIPYHTVFMIL